MKNEDSPMNLNTILFLTALPVCATAMQIGAWVGGEGTTPQPTQANVDAFETLQDRPLDLISVFALWQYNDWAWTKTYADIAANNGSTLVVTWMPNDYAVADINSGVYDSYITEFANGVKDFGKEIWIRPFHEANGTWYTWAVGNSSGANTNATVAEAFRHVVTIFKNLNVTNVKWVWTTNNKNSTAATSYTGTYPGDDYVDYISIDGYNWGKSQSWASWQSFSSVFSASYKALANINKPLFIAEFSSSEIGGDKAQWITDMFSVLPTQFPKIMGLMWFSQSKSSTEADWALNTSDAAVTAWKEGLTKNYPVITSLPKSMSIGNKPFKINIGSISLMLSSANIVQISQVDLKGKTLWQSQPQSLSAGTYQITVPKISQMSLWRIRIGNSVYVQQVAPTRF